MRIKWFLLFIIFLASCSCIVPIHQSERINNFYQVDAYLYRGAQPTRAGFESLQALGIKTIVNLRNDHEDIEDLRGLGLHYVNIPVSVFSVNKNSIKQFLAIMRNEDNLPVFIHCQRGADRTGLMVAAWRIETGWDRKKATSEMIFGGFGFNPLLVWIPFLLR